MADLKYYDVILKPVITEKSMNSMAERNMYSTFIRMQQRDRLKKLLKRCLKAQKLKKSTQ